MRLVNTRRRPGLLDFEGVKAAYFRRDSAGIGRVAGDEAPGASMKTKKSGCCGKKPVLDTPNCFKNLDELLHFFVVFCFVCKQMPRYPPSLE